MSFYLGPDSSGKNIMHATSDVKSADELKGSKYGTTYFHSELPFLTVEAPAVGYTVKDVTTSAGVAKAIYMPDLAVSRGKIFIDSVTKSQIIPYTFAGLIDSFSATRTAVYMLYNNTFITVANTQFDHVVNAQGYIIYQFPSYLIFSGNPLEIYTVNLDGSSMLYPTAYNPADNTISITGDGLTLRGVDLSELKYINFGTLNTTDPYSTINSCTVQLVNYYATLNSLSISTANGFSLKRGNNAIIAPGTSRYVNTESIVFEEFDNCSPYSVLSTRDYANGTNLLVSINSPSMGGYSCYSNNNGVWCNVAYNGTFPNVIVPMKCVEGASVYFSGGGYTQACNSRNLVVFKLEYSSGKLSLSYYVTTYVVHSSAASWPFFASSVRVFEFT